MVKKPCCSQHCVSSVEQGVWSPVSSVHSKQSILLHHSWVVAVLPEYNCTAAVLIGVSCQWNVLNVVVLLHHHPTTS